jgi:hypothetical protein
VVSLPRGDRAWRIGTDAEVLWIVGGTTSGLTVTSAIPPVFDAYATVVIPDTAKRRESHDQAMLALLSEQSAHQPWWLGYIETGADDTVFPDAPKVTLYAGWPYVVVEAGPRKAATWRRRRLETSAGRSLPDLMFPADRSWLVSRLWDDDWTCIGGPTDLMTRFSSHPVLEARPVALDEDATPPGHHSF